MRLDYIFETALYVSDLEEAEQFYAQLLDAAPFASIPGRHVFFKLRHGMLLLFLAEATAAPDSELPPHGAVGPGHLAFRVETTELPNWHRRLGELQIATEKVWIWPNGAESIYFRDPSGNLLEITEGRLWGY